MLKLLRKTKLRFLPLMDRNKKLGVRIRNEEVIEENNGVFD